MTGWLERVGPFAYGVMGLHPWELRRYTLREFGHRVQGYQEADRASWRKVATLACWVLAPHVDRNKAQTLTPDALLGYGQAVDL